MKKQPTMMTGPTAGHRINGPSVHDVEDRLLPLTAVMDIVGLGKSMIYRLEREGKFPQRYKPGGSASRWSEQEVLAWRIEQRVARTA
jgi:prophage regulatory protein